MSKRYTFLDFAEEVLEHTELPLTPSEIWEAGQEKFHKKLGATGKTPDRTIGARLYVDVGNNTETKFIAVGSAPARFFLKSRISELQDDYLQKIQKKEIKQTTSKADYEERELHPLLAYLAYTSTILNKGKKIFTKTIRHEKSKKSGYNDWVHPDMVGFYIPINDWSERLLEFNKIADINAIKLFSFEIKRKIDRSNYREYFFQAVSNSSWANEGYLVAAEIKDDDDFRGELERLSASFGIGIVKINLDNIDSPDIISLARTNSDLDWELMNKLYELNPEFKNWIRNITTDYNALQIHKEKYDAVIDPTAHIKKILKHKT